jgi:hypothetical protein
MGKKDIQAPNLSLGVIFVIANATLSQRNSALLVNNADVCKDNAVFLITDPTISPRNSHFLVNNATEE